MKNYDDIINLPHPVSKKHPRMSNYNRAVQFAPFAALAGYKEAIEAVEKELASKISSNLSVSGSDTEINQVD